MTTTTTNPDPTRACDDGRRIFRAETAWRREALARLLSVHGYPQVGAAARFMDYASANAIALDDLWVMIGPDHVVRAAVLGVPSPGRTAMVFLSEPTRETPVAQYAELFAALWTALGERGVRLAQGLLDHGEKDKSEALLAGGLARLADLSYLSRPVPSARYQPEIAWPAGATLESYREEARAGFLEALQASYVETLDCPELNGLRGLDDILTGHMATAAFDPALWSLLRLDGRPAGIILLNPSPASRSVELVYFGIADWARRRGHARRLLRHGLASIAGRREKQIMLAVDDRNDPARALYASEGFRRVFRRMAFIRPLRAEHEESSARREA